MRPDWLNDIVRAFGRQMGLKTFAMNEAGSAGVRFENGRELRLEYASGYLAMLVTMPAVHEAETAKRVLAQAHPAARRPVRVRSGFFAKEARAFFMARLSERDVTVDALERLFRVLWEVALAAGRAA